MTDNLFTSDTIFNNNTVIRQPRNGFRFSSDALLLAWFISNKTSSGGALEVGSGSGVISILLKKRGFRGDITAVEIDEATTSLLKENITANNLDDVINPIGGDFFSQDVIALQERYDIVFSNPPFFSSTNSQLLSDNTGKYNARHEVLFTIPEFSEKSSKILKKGGNLFVVFPVERMQYLLANLERNSLYAQEIIFIKEHQTNNPSLFLLHARKRKNKNAMPLKSINFITIKNSDDSLTKTGEDIFYDTSS
ncbi:methyltransferase [bacterium]|nr:methyltransferase [bacterium]